jgi:Tfp pilus assembly protein PilN
MSCHPAGTRYLVVMAVACVALLNLGTQVRSLRGDADQLSTEHRQALAERDVYKVSILKKVNDFLSSRADAFAGAGEQVSSDGLYIIVDSECVWCKVSLEKFRTRGSPLPLRVMSFANSRNELQTWLEALQMDTRMAADSTLAEIFALLPTTATPIFLEVREGLAHDIVIGQPKEEWFGRGAEQRN